MIRPVHPRHVFLPLAVAGVLSAAACSSIGNGNGASSASAAAGGGASTVLIRSSDVGDVLTDTDGRTLYTSDQENRDVLCRSDACTSVWLPLTLDAGRPTAPAGLSSPLGVVKRPGGQLQVTMGGKPLYRFSFDHAAGQVTGNGQSDSFDGTAFTWHAAVVRAGKKAPSKVASPSSGGGYGY
jgi:predicted lipoprotein with Yx(FWY)xxD motif